VRLDIDPSIPVDATGAANPGVECWVGTGIKFLLLNDCCGPPMVGTLAHALTTDTVAVSVDTP